MRDFLTLFTHLIMTLVRLMGPGGARPIVAESLFVKHQQLIVNRFRQRACGVRILISNVSVADFNRDEETCQTFVTVKTLSNVM